MADKLTPTPECQEEDPDLLDPLDSDMALDQLKGHTTLHAKPPRLEDEGQSGG
jgi:hypothetical protein